MVVDNTKSVEKGLAKLSEQAPIRKYLCAVPGIDPSTYTVTHQSSKTVSLNFSGLFPALLFLTRLFNAFIYAGMSWDYLIMTFVGSDKINLDIGVEKNQKSNRMKLCLYNLINRSVIK